MATSASRLIVTAVLIVSVFTLRVQAQPAGATTAASVLGVYNGTYAGAQDPIKFKLSLTQQSNATLAGEFTLYVAEGSATNAYTCDVRGTVYPGESNAPDAARPMENSSARRDRRAGNERRV
ncbi:MAG TPA: hypothetical protein VGM64_16740 [Lacunisphaera sp.]|jgi:hypothetical protein